MKTIDKRDAKRLLRKTVKGRESFLYKMPPSSVSCKYQFKGKPSCLVGTALFNAGVPIKALKTFDAYNESSIDSIAPKLENYGLRLTDGAVEVLTKAQRVQDAGTWITNDDHTWGKAVDEACKL